MLTTQRYLLPNYSVDIDQEYNNVNSKQAICQYWQN